MLANEKRRRRRESHNAVERRRRDNINEKISELATLIPECMLDPSGECLILARNASHLVFLCVMTSSSSTLSSAYIRGSQRIYCLFERIYTRS